MSLPFHSFSTPIKSQPGTPISKRLLKSTPVDADSEYASANTSFAGIKSVQTPLLNPLLSTPLRDPAQSPYARSKSAKSPLSFDLSAMKSPFNFTQFAKVSPFVSENQRSSPVTPKRTVLSGVKSSAFTSSFSRAKSPVHSLSLPRQSQLQSPPVSRETVPVMLFPTSALYLEAPLDSLPLSALEDNLPTGEWSHPLMAEVQHNLVNKEMAGRKLVVNVLLVMAVHLLTKVASLRPIQEFIYHSRVDSELLEAGTALCQYAYWALVGLFCYNIISCAVVVLQKQAPNPKITDLTEKQRRLMGLEAAGVDSETTFDVKAAAKPKYQRHLSFLYSDRAKSVVPATSFSTSKIRGTTSLMVGAGKIQSRRGSLVGQPPLPKVELEVQSLSPSDRKSARVDEEHLKSKFMKRFSINIVDEEDSEAEELANKSSAQRSIFS
ncbi:hypothetical protein BABINDRAFT_163288 [Babjeviella inositovora NRRL Y-12698]|uniref:Nucleoporin POM34 n=1 Tax=Babjeviella inositovora NRRL Y-12698 TaxID=984486 RepID=A0A1E3QJP9_9ASCO|nr:uncharacterized protein BABINDRAFT_163288 [Babjeviella inositovora NRRL Y-12698]ODQ77921.1 hypothetical protein BABINDRAFT_163288 [Babjeviella inositovora NRRL Y-12698]